MPRRRGPTLAPRKPDTISVTSHAQQPPRVPTSHDEEYIYAPWLDIISDHCEDSAGARLHDEIMAYVSYMASTPREEAVVARVKQRVSAVLRQAFKNCEVHVFGSTETGLRLPGSDVDLIIETTDTSNRKKVLQKLSTILKTHRWCNQKSVQVIPRARVPIISFATTPEFGSVKFDVGINNMNGLNTGAFVKEHLRTMPALKPLVLVIKKALSQRDLNDASQAGISSFAVICMCIFFLQINPYGIPEDHLVDPVKTKSLGFILYDFLAYYSEGLPYQEMYISVSQGRLVPKETASWIGDDYANSLVIQCPCDSKRNITKTLSPGKFNKLKSLFIQAYEGIGNSSGGSRNILSILVLVNMKFIEHRKHVAAVRPI